MIIGDADVGPQMTYGLRGDLRFGFAHVFATKQELPVEVRDIDRVEVDLQVEELFKIKSSRTFCSPYPHLLSGTSRGER